MGHLILSLPLQLSSLTDLCSDLLEKNLQWVSLKVPELVKMTRVGSSVRLRARYQRVCENTDCIMLIIVLPWLSPPISMAGVTLSPVALLFVSPLIPVSSS